MSWTLCWQPDLATNPGMLKQAIASHKAMFWTALSSSGTPRD